MMDEPALRGLIREAISKHLGASGHDASPPQRLALASHPSHFRYALPGSGEACLIEPAVQCNHCGYCQSHGH